MEQFFRVIVKRNIIKSVWNAVLWISNVEFICKSFDQAILTEVNVSWQFGVRYCATTICHSDTGKYIEM